MIRGIVASMRYVALLMVVLLLVSCGGGSDSANTVRIGSDATPQVSDADASPTPRSKPEQPDEEQPEPTAAEDEPAEESTNLSNFDGYLKELDSYRLSFKWSFDGVDDAGAQQKGSITITQEVINETQDMRYSIETEGSAVSSGMNPGVFSMYQVGKTTYMLSTDQAGKQSCLGLTNDQMTSAGMVNPNDMVGSLNGAKLVKRGEMVNGIKTNHYTFDEKALTFGTYTKASGDVWIAQDGEYPVKYEGSATGKQMLGMQGQGEGTVSWTYLLEAINEVEAIELPGECAGQQPSTDIPVPPNAKNTTSMGSMTTFSTSDSVANMEAFYKDELPKQGWEFVETTMATPELVMLSFRKESRTISVTITGVNGETTVLITDAP